MKIGFQNACYAACIACVIDGQSLASTTNVTNDVQTISLTNTFPYMVTLERTETYNTWFGLWSDEFSYRSTSILSDTFGHRMLSYMSRSDQGYQVITTFNTTGRNAIQRATLNSIRESIVELPGISRSRDFLDGFFVGLLSRTTIESINPTEPIPSEMQMSWWEEMRSNGSVKYGSHILDGDLLYVSARFGRLNKKPLGMAFIRWRGDPFSVRSTIDGTVSFFPSRSSAITFGGSYELANLRNSHNIRWSAAWSHAVGKDWRDGSLSLGVSGNGHENAIHTGYNVRF